jgi:GT2 family glycosyltransferase
MPNHIPKVVIIILHFDSRDTLTECLRSCQRISHPNHEIIIVKTGLRSNLRLASMQDIASSVSKIINTKENVGYARGNNLGIQDALSHKADYVLLLNDDTIVSPNFLEILVEVGERSPDIGMLGPKIYYFDEPNKVWFAGAGFDYQTCRVIAPASDQVDQGEDSVPFESDYITGCALLVKRAAIERIGLLDERFFLYWEDVDWGLRAKKARLTNLVVPSSHIWHKVSVSIGGPDSPLKAYHKTRSHLLIAKLHAPGALNKLQRGYFRDIAWLLLKSSDKDRIKKARAYFSAIRDYHFGRTNGGLSWLWQH